MATQKSLLLLKRINPREDDFRGGYFRDTTAIIHSYPFRRLKHKTQVFFSPKNDHICTRIEHVMHVASVASAICKGLNLDSELAWAIGLGHDLGHTPFGHAGERAIRQVMPDFEHNKLACCSKIRAIWRIVKDDKSTVEIRVFPLGN